MVFNSESLSIIGNDFLCRMFNEQKIYYCKRIITYYEILCGYFEYLYFYCNQFGFQILDNLVKKNPVISTEISIIYASLAKNCSEFLHSGAIYHDDSYMNAIRNIADKLLLKSNIRSSSNEFRFNKHIKLIMNLSMTFEVLTIDVKKTENPFASLKKFCIGVSSMLFLSLENSLYMLLPNELTPDILLKIQRNINDAKSYQKVLFHCGHSIPMQVTNPRIFNQSDRNQCKFCKDRLYTMDIGLARKNHWRNEQKNICGKCSSLNANEFLCIDCEWPFCRGCLNFTKNQCVCSLCKFMNIKKNFQQDVAMRFITIRKSYSQSQIINQDFNYNNQYQPNNVMMQTIKDGIRVSSHPLNSNFHNQNFGNAIPTGQSAGVNQNLPANPNAVNQPVNEPRLENSCSNCKDFKTCVYCNGLFDNKFFATKNKFCKICYQILKFKCYHCQTHKVCNAIFCDTCKNISYENNLIDFTENMKRTCEKEGKDFLIFEKICTKCKKNKRVECVCDCCNSKSGKKIIKGNELNSIDKGKCYYGNCVKSDLKECAECKNKFFFCDKHMNLHMKIHNTRSQIQSELKTNESNQSYNCPTCKTEQTQLSSTFCKNCKLIYANSEYFVQRSLYDSYCKAYCDYESQKLQCSNCHNSPTEIKHCCLKCLSLLKTQTPETESDKEQNSLKSSDSNLKCYQAECMFFNCKKCSKCEIACCDFHNADHEKVCHSNFSNKEIENHISPKTKNTIKDLIKITRNNIIKSCYETIKIIQNYSNEMINLLDEIEFADDSLKNALRENRCSEIHYENYSNSLYIPELEVNNYDAKKIAEMNITTFIKDIKFLREKYDEKNKVFQFYREKKKINKSVSEGNSASGNLDIQQSNPMNDPNS
ncbi:hypothetical protein SteCoe_4368 [Stentor coeruleus]|uniref:Uncharacterized protein n=1 Tax=Stentor coeruleus TaxID=5963 RepID=A0A1R2CV09_9CILI|nr:hypothetical protein SteCoe_4368 [Stentor coeruleus]